MAHNPVQLITFLQRPLPNIPHVAPTATPRNTTNDAYSAGDINDISQWQNFNLAAVINEYGPILNQTQIPDNPFRPSPSPPIRSENMLKSRLNDYVLPRVRGSLRVAFAQLRTLGLLDHKTELTFDAGDAAITIENFLPDTSFCPQDAVLGTAYNRAPGDLKPSWKWSTGMYNASRREAREFRQALSQVNWYMKQNRTRYGFILTDQELVTIRRLDDHGNLELSPSIPFTVSGTPEQPQLTILLALWYLGMLAAQDEAHDGIEAWQL